MRTRANTRFTCCKLCLCILLRLAWYSTLLVRYSTGAMYLLILLQMADYGGAFHCATADVFREGGLESYFPLFDAAEARGEEVNLPL